MRFQILYNILYINNGWGRGEEGGGVIPRSVPQETYFDDLISNSKLKTP